MLCFFIGMLKFFIQSEICGFKVVLYLINIVLYTIAISMFTTSVKLPDLISGRVHGCLCRIANGTGISRSVHILSNGDFKMRIE